jgi:hypothetical protein
MGKAEFRNKIYLYGLVLLISVTLIFNLYALLFDFELKYILPTILQITLLFLIFIKHKLIKIILKIWSAIFFIIAFGLMILGGLLKDLANTFQDVDFLSYLKYSVFFIYWNCNLYRC